MKFTTTALLATAATLTHAHSVNEASFEGGVLEIRAGWTLAGCYKSAGSLTLNGTNTYQSSGACEKVASGKDVNVIALTSGSTCYYGNELPSTSDKTHDSDCSTPCQGYNKENCGGPSAFTVWTNGDVVAAAAGSSSDDADSSSTTTPSTAPSPSAVSVITTSGGVQTIFVTPTNDAAAAAATVSVTPSATAGSSGSSHSSTVGIAVGVVVGVVGAAAIAAAIFFWLRSKKSREEAAELQRQNSITGLRSEKPPSTYSLPDSRLEPAYMRRMSDGSIADNQDYSRRILKVTNPE